MSGMFVLNLDKKKTDATAWWQMRQFLKKLIKWKKKTLRRSEYFYNFNKGKFSDKLNKKMEKKI